MFKTLNRLTKIDCPEIWAVFQGVNMDYKEFCKIRGIPYNQEKQGLANPDGYGITGNAETKPQVAKQPNEGVSRNPIGRPPKEKTE